MNIAVDSYALTERPSGISNYVRKTLLALSVLDEENRYFLYSKCPFSFPAYGNIVFRFDKQERRAPSYENTLWLFTKGIWMMKRDKIDIFWGTRQMLPPYLPGGIKTVLTVHDLVWHYFPETMDTYNRIVLKPLFKHSVKSADHIITVSEATKHALTEILGMPKNEITVAYNAADGFSPLDKVSSAEYISAKYGANRNYILTVSTVEPRKNLITLLRAFSGMKDTSYQLLIAGAKGWKTTSIFMEYEKLGLTEKEVKFLGFVPDEDMNRLYSGAAIFVFPSIYEGFGIPALEAMASGTPVIASNTSSLPEVVGDAGILLDPFDVEGWRSAIFALLSDNEKTKVMTEAGLRQASKFSWQESAKKTLGVFQKLKGL